MWKKSEKRWKSEKRVEEYHTLTEEHSRDGKRDWGISRRPNQQNLRRVETDRASKARRKNRKKENWKEGASWEITFKRR